MVLNADIGKLLSDNLALYLSKVGEAAPSLPMYYYHIPTMTGVNCKHTRWIAEALYGVSA